MKILENPHADWVVVNLWMSVKTLLSATVLFGLLYPVFLALVGGTLFPHQASGSLVELGERAVASRHLGLDWSGSGLFEGRPSAAPAGGSGASHLALSNPALGQTVRERVERWHRLTGSSAPVPLDLVEASASGYDPDITRRAALYQIPMVARSTGLEPETLRLLVEETAREDFLSGMPEPLVNVLELNRRTAAEAGIDLARIFSSRSLARKRGE